MVVSSSLELGPGSAESETLVARSPAMRRVLDLARRAAASDATVLVTGESGTGKERLARFIHATSPRRDGAFVAIDCGALPDTLLESELFGHRRGAFTGATHDKEGLFVSASGGTIFLDEIGETSPALQVRLLRVLQERVVRPVGATRDVPVDVRVVAATHRDLEAMVGEGRFRQDLYYRLCVVPLRLPPLRERREDVLPLAQAFIAETCRRNHCGPCSLSSSVLDALQSYLWPGNVRELQNVIERAVVLAGDKPQIQLDDLPPELRGAPAHLAGEAGAILPLAEVERRHILATLERLGGDRKATAKALGISANTLWRRLKRYGLVRPRRRRVRDAPEGDSA